LNTIPDKPIKNNNKNNNNDSVHDVMFKLFNIDLASPFDMASINGLFISLAVKKNVLSTFVSAILDVTILLFVL